MGVRQITFEKVYDVIHFRTAIAEPCGDSDCGCAEYPAHIVWAAWPGHDSWIAVGGSDEQSRFSEEDLDELCCDQAVAFMARVALLLGKPWALCTTEMAAQQMRFQTGLPAVIIELIQALDGEWLPVIFKRMREFDEHRRAALMLDALGSDPTLN
jgi:hypothetical protein